jgi:non-specific serine/threonine protein kinase
LGHLILAPAADAMVMSEELRSRIDAAFEGGAIQGLLLLGLREIGTALPPAVAFWRDFAARYVTALCKSDDADGVPAPADLDALLAAAPPMAGGEYLTVAVLESLWEQIHGAYVADRARSRLTLQDYLKAHHAAWNLVGRIHFNLAENRNDVEAPFAFIATYTTRLSAQGRAQHLPLAEALREYAGAKNSARLLSLLQPIQRAAAQCGWLGAMVDAGEIYHAIRWTPAEALQFLTDTPTLEAAGIVVRSPRGWALGRPARPQVRATVGGKVPSLLGGEALLDFSVELTLGDERLTAAEIRSLLACADGLQFLRGRWVEVDREKLVQLLERFRRVEATAAAGGLAFGDALRLVAGVTVGAHEGAEADATWSAVAPGPWLAETLRGLRGPEGLAQVEPGPALRAILRPYQQAGVRWLYLLNRLGLGACLADDMGLGKTIQVLSLLLVLRERGGTDRSPSLLVAPASLLANWEAEIERFAPSLAVLVAHPSSMSPSELRAVTPELVASQDLVITSYGALLRHPWLSSTTWRIAVLDEAQAIKNPGAKQTRAVKKLNAGTRIALTGTPVENGLGDLWSIFDFTNPGLLGSAKAFASYVKRLSQQGDFGALRTLVKPYILRRLKTDKTVIADLPDKTEVKAYCSLSPTQAALYQKAVADLATALDDAEGLSRKGTVLQSSVPVARRCRLGGGRQRQVRALAGDRRGHRREAGEDAGVHAVSRGRATAGGLSRRDFRPRRVGAPWGHAGCRAQGARPSIPGGRTHSVLRVVAQGGRLRAQSHRCLACGAFRSLVEPRRRKSSHRSRVPDRAVAQRAGAKIHLSRHGRG